MNQANELQAALEHHLSGRLREAEAIYRDVLKRNADDAAASYLLGVACHQTGRLPEALPLLEKASRLVPAAGDVQNYLSIALRDAGRIDEAIAAARKAIDASPAMTEAHVNLGIALQFQGDLAGAAEAYGQAIRIKPDFAAAHNNLGNVLQARGNFAAAEEAYRRSLQFDPKSASTHNNLGSVLQDLERPDDAVEACRAAIALRPDFAEAHNNLGNALRERGEVSAAIESFRRAIQIRPDYAKAHSNYLFALHFDPSFEAAAIRAEHEKWAASQAEELTRRSPPPERRDFSPRRRLRIGYVSPDLREHPVGRFMLPVISRHDREQFEVICYSDARAQDQVTEAVRGRADVFVATSAMSDEQLADRVRADDIDILIDLALHSGRNRLLVFARRPAPVQATYLGYPGTSGMRAMDFRLTDPHLDPAGESDAAYTETSVRLPRTYWCYAPPTNMPDVEPLPASPNGHVTFGCLNKFTKVSDLAVATWGRLLAGVPRARLILHAPPGEARRRVLAAMAKENVAADRVEFVRRRPALEYLQTYNRIDIALDPFPYNGGTTTCEALLMGVPVVTLTGDVAVRRAGASILSNAGMPELVARSPQAYVQIATGLAWDLNSLAAMRRDLREKMLASPLTDREQFVRDLEAAYRLMWDRKQQQCPTGSS